MNLHRIIAMALVLFAPLSFGKSHSRHKPKTSDPQGQTTTTKDGEKSGTSAQGTSTDSHEANQGKNEKTNNPQENAPSSGGGW